MKMKHKKIAFALLAIGLLFSSCNKNNRIAAIINQRIFGDENMNEKNSRTCEQIIKCLQTKDIDAMYDLFSEKTKNEVPDLKNDIEDFFAIYNGTISSYHNSAKGVFESKDLDKNICSYRNDYECLIDGIKYSLLVKNTVINTVVPEEEGVTSIKLVKDDDREEYIKALEPGIFIPTDANYYN